MHDIIEHYGKVIVALAGVLAAVLLTVAVVKIVNTKTTTAVDNISYEQQIQDAISGEGSKEQGLEKEQGLKGYIRQNRAELFREIEDLIQNEDVTDIEWDGYYLWVTDLKKGCYCHNIRLNEEYVDNLAIRLANIMKVPFNRAYPILEANTEDLRIL